MANWNYRVIKRATPGSKEVTFQIHEIFYHDDGSINCWNNTPVEPLGVSEPGLRNDIHSFLSAFRLPVLEEKIIDGKPHLRCERLPKSRDALQADYASKATRASSYINQVLGSHLLLKREPALRKAYDKVDQALNELYTAVHSHLDVIEN